MNEVSKENDNHCVSGGFIFDKMDRFAHDYWKKNKILKGIYLLNAHTYITVSKFATLGM